MSYSHRVTDVRTCGAVTLQQGQDFVTINGQLWAVEGDPNSDGAGGLIASQDYVTISGLLVILQGDSANQDNLCQVVGGDHCNPAAQGFDDLVEVN